MTHLELTGKKEIAMTANIDDYTFKLSTIKKLAQLTFPVDRAIDPNSQLNKGIDAFVSQLERHARCILNTLDNELFYEDMEEI